jgi:hypothetical protein
MKILTVGTFEPELNKQPLFIKTRVEPVNPMMCPVGCAGELRVTHAHHESRSTVMLNCEHCNWTAVAQSIDLALEIAKSTKHAIDQ